MSQAVLPSDLQNKSVYEGSDTVEHYAQASGLQPAEKLLFDKYLQPDMALLDIGVGGGRTTAELKDRVKSYVGIDYSTAMVEATRAKFPALDLRVMDASDLSAFPDASFDMIVFSFNGLDYLHPVEKRASCLKECRRVLKLGGKLVYSSHNPRWLGIVPLTRGVSPVRAVWRIAYAAVRSLQLAFTQPLHGAFWVSRGYFRDPVHGGLVTYSLTPGSVSGELSDSGFKLRDWVGGSVFPFAPVVFQPWIYYAAERFK